LQALQHQVLLGRKNNQQQIECFDGLQFCESHITQQDPFHFVCKSAHLKKIILELIPWRDQKFLKAKQRKELSLIKNIFRLGKIFRYLMVQTKKKPPTGGSLIRQKSSTDRDFLTL
jgi:hypothetical protein